MNFRLIIGSILLAVSSISLRAYDRYVGGDISLLPDYEEAKAKYFDENGKAINDFLQFCYDEGMNCMRVRLFVNPSDYTADKDENAKQDLEYILPLCKRIKRTGLSLMLDFHYSDTWADPAKQWTPLAWQGLTKDELYREIYTYTKETLETLKASGVVPDFIQPGNEISYGMLWGAPGGSNPLKVYSNSEANWDYFTTLLRNAIKACREVCPDAKIVLHNERVAQPSELKNFYRNMDKYEVEYDIIGLSYYPYFHGNMKALDTALTTMEQTFPEKNIMIVETGYAYAWEVPGTNQKVDYPYSEAGQNRFATELVETLLGHKNVDGLFWWWMEYNAYGTGLQGWYNAPLIDSRTGKVTQAFKTICGFGNGHFGSVESVTGDGQPGAWYDLQGRRLIAPTLPGIYIRNGKKVIIR